MMSYLAQTFQTEAPIPNKREVVGSRPDPTTSYGRRRYGGKLVCSGGAQSRNPGAPGAGGRPGQPGQLRGPQREQLDRVGGGQKRVRHDASVVERHRRDRFAVDEGEQYVAVERPRVVKRGESPHDRRFV